MTPHHAVEITLTRPAAPGELRHARCGMPLAANADRTRLMAVHGARSPGGALHALRRRLDALLPIDVLSTYYPLTGTVRSCSTSPSATQPTGHCAGTRLSWDSGPRTCSADA